MVVCRERITSAKEHAGGSNKDVRREIDQGMVRTEADTDKCPGLEDYPHPSGRNQGGVINYNCKHCNPKGHGIM